MTPVDELVERGTRWVGPLWPLDQAVACNPLLDVTDTPFAQAVEEFGHRLGTTLWPTREHLAAVGIAKPSDEPAVIDRPGTVAERHFGSDSPRARQIRRAIGQVLLAATSDASGERLASFASALRDPAVDVALPAALRRHIADSLDTATLAATLERLGWDDDLLVEEMARHCARLPGWAGWAKWNDQWAPRPHHAGLSRREFLTLSLSVDLARLDRDRGSIRPPQSSPVVATGGAQRLRQLETKVHHDVIELLSGEVTRAARPRWQFLTCIDVRSEPLRRALEAHDDVETFGFAGFFAVAATVRAIDEDEEQLALPVLLRPTARISGGAAPTSAKRDRSSLREVLTELTHEPQGMFAIAEGAGWLSAGAMVASTYVSSRLGDQGAQLRHWSLETDDPAAVAESLLVGTGLTRDFAPEVVIVGHGARSRANTHYSTLDCGACAARGGGPNAAVAAALLNDEAVRHELAQRGITIPTTTRFIAALHNTTTEEVIVDAPASAPLRARLDKATAAVRHERQVEARRLGLATPRRYQRRALDWAQTRPEWGLTGHAAFLIGPRRSSRGLDLRGRVFLHSYEADDDASGEVLASIMGGPVVVAQWINAAYYFSSVAPDTLGAGDKTTLNPVGDFGVLRGDDPDLAPGLPRQSLFVGARPVHSPVRLLVAVEAPLGRLDQVVRDSPEVLKLAAGGWIRLVARARAHDAWREWTLEGWASPS